MSIHTKKDLEKSNQDLKKTIKLLENSFETTIFKDGNVEKAIEIRKIKDWLTELINWRAIFDEPLKEVML